MSPPKETKQDSKVSSPNTSSSSSDKSATNQNIIKKPKRLRKQLNNREFKKFYFELVPNVSEEPSFTTVQDSYQVKKFETSHSNDEFIRNAIKAHSSHFCLNNTKKTSRKLSSPTTSNSTVAVTCKEPSQNTCQTINDRPSLHATTFTSCSTIQQQQQVPPTSSSLDSLLDKSLQTSHVKLTIMDSELMLTLDYEDIMEQLCNENSPYNQSLKHLKDIK